MYWDDKYNTETVSAEVLGKMKQQMMDSNSSSSHSFLLDDDSTLPFAAAEVRARERVEGGGGHLYAEVCVCVGQVHVCMGGAQSTQTSASGDACGLLVGRPQ